VGDSDTAAWGLKKRVGPENGDVLAYRDETGRPFDVKLVGKLPMRLSVFQGTVLVPMWAFNQRFPSEAGYRVFLFDYPGVQAPDGSGAAVEEMGAALTRRMDEIGLDVVPAVERLAEFYSVESTYLGMFLVLGGLGLLLGSLGVGLVLLRNVLERRAELAILRCLGFSKGQVGRVVMAEHWFLLVMGMLVGLVAAGLAIWPHLRAPGAVIPYGTMAGLLLAVPATGFAWICIASRIALRGEVLHSLRNE
jgi:hypothetical protein